MLHRSQCCRHVPKLFLPEQLWPNIWALADQAELIKEIKGRNKVIPGMLQTLLNEHSLGTLVSGVMAALRFSNLVQSTKTVFRPISDAIFRKYLFVPRIREVSALQSVPYTISVSVD